MGWRTVEEYLLAFRPWSVRAAVVALLAFVAGALLRVAFTPLGVTLNFATFFPSVLVASVVAGIPAGVLTAVLSAIFVWWALLDPVFVFNGLRPVDYANFTLFFFSAGLIVALAHVYRVALAGLLLAERSQSFLIEELNHRAGNTLTVVQSIVNGTVKDKEVQQQLTHRIGALARTNRLVVKEDGAVSLSSLILSEVEPYAPLDRVDLEGPSVLLSGDAARNVGLVIHELATNSAKYGAFSKQDGRLSARWSEHDGSCRLSWTEVDGPPVISPTRTGFGSRMMKACLATMQGTIEPEFRPEGYRCTLSFPASPERTKAGAISTATVHDAKTAS